LDAKKAQLRRAVVDFKGRGAYGVRFDDRPDVVEYVDSHWMGKAARSWMAASARRRQDWSKEVMPSDQQGFQFTGRQQLVYQSLAAKSNEFAELYECALRSLSDNANPGRVFQAAHSIREMAGGLPKILDLPVLADLGRLGDQVNALQTAWESALQSSCHHAQSY
jgi:hypothetical protein